MNVLTYIDIHLFTKIFMNSFHFFYQCLDKVQNVVKHYCIDDLFYREAQGTKM